MRGCLFVESVTCLAAIETTSVDASSVSPNETIYVVFPAVVWRIAYGGVLASVASFVPMRRLGFNRTGRGPTEWSEDVVADNRAVVSKGIKSNRREGSRTT